MQLRVSDKFDENWGNADSYYVIWKSTNGYKWVGMVRTIPLAGGLDYHLVAINVLKVNGDFAPGFGSMALNDPYSYLPRHLQSFQWNSNDQDAGRDKIGWNPTTSWVELPLTGVPATWVLETGSTDQGRVGFAWNTDPNCWTGRTELHQAVTYEPASGQVPWDSQGTYQIDFYVLYSSRNYGWWSCYGNAWWEQVSKRVTLPL